MIEYGELSLRMRMMTMVQVTTDSFETGGSISTDLSSTQFAKKHQNESGGFLDKGTTKVQRL